jgi:hypothetical protein
MIDKYIIKFCEVIDNSFMWLENLFESKNKYKKKKNGK